MRKRYFDARVGIFQYQEKHLEKVHKGLMMKYLLKDGGLSQKAKLMLRSRRKAS